MTLHVFSNGVDFVIAYDVDDAWRVFTEHIGESRDDYEKAYPMKQLPDSKEIAVDGRVHTAGIWASTGRQYLACTEE